MIKKIEKPINVSEKVLRVNYAYIYPYWKSDTTICSKIQGWE